MSHHVTLESIIERAEKLGEPLASDIADSINKHAIKYEQDGRQLAGSADVIAAAFILITRGADYLAAISGSDVPLDIIREAKNKIINQLITTPQMTAAGVASGAVN